MSTEVGDIRTIYRGADTVLRFERRTVGSVTGWTTKFFLRQSVKTDDPPLLSIAGVTTVEGGPSTIAVFEVTISQAASLILTERTYAYSFKRTNMGASKVLREGRAFVKADIEHAL